MASLPDGFFTPENLFPEEKDNDRPTCWAEPRLSLNHPENSRVLDFGQ
jgi:hypothetical protein